MKKEYTGVVKEIVQQLELEGNVLHTPKYNIKYKCVYNDGILESIYVTEKSVNCQIPHVSNTGAVCTSAEFENILNMSYPDEELIHLVCERFFRQYNIIDNWGLNGIFSLLGIKINNIIVGTNYSIDMLNKHTHFGTPLNKVYKIKDIQKTKHSTIIGFNII